VSTRGRCALLASLALVVVACSPGVAPVPATAVACGAPSPKVADPTGVTSPGYRIGPLMLAGFAVETAPSSPVPVGGPTKVLIHPVEAFDQPITLSGARCSDGQPLRFWYGPVHQGTPFSLGPRSTPVPEAVLAQTGELSVRIEPHSGTATNAAGTFDYTGYMLFTTTGTWRVRAQSSGRGFDEAVVLVGAP
jgi:hypothetical protein